MTIGVGRPTSMSSNGSLSQPACRPLERHLEHTPLAPAIQTAAAQQVSGDSTKLAAELGSKLSSKLGSNSAIEVTGPNFLGQDGIISPASNNVTSISEVPGYGVQGTLSDGSTLQVGALRWFGAQGEDTVARMAVAWNDRVVAAVNC